MDMLFIYFLIMFGRLVRCNASSIERPPSLYSTHENLTKQNDSFNSLNNSSTSEKADFLTRSKPTNQPPSIQYNREQSSHSSAQLIYQPSRQPPIALSGRSTALPNFSSSYKLSTKNQSILSTQTTHSDTLAATSNPSRCDTPHTATPHQTTDTDLYNNKTTREAVHTYSRSSLHLLNLNPTMMPTQLPTNNRCVGGTMYNTRCFHLAGSSMSWTNCETHCLNQGWRMLCVDSATTNTFIQNTFSSYTLLWLGLNDQATENSFVWSGGCTPSTYRSWKAGEPNNAVVNEDCVELVIASGLWNDSPCTLLKGCGCETRWTAEPTTVPTQNPTVTPTRQPTFQPTRQPTQKPTAQPSATPTIVPTAVPTRRPTFIPTAAPSAQPTRQPSSQPTSQPSAQPMVQPTREPTTQPSSQPSAAPSSQPSRQPSLQPTTQPTGQPTSPPSRQPSKQPSAQPTAGPTSQPSRQPSAHPTKQPTVQPTMEPSAQPSRQPSSQPTKQPTLQPSHQPSTEPSSQPSLQPSMQPSGEPSAQPSIQPSMEPSVQPSIQPSGEPTNQPSSRPSMQPSTQPTDMPSNRPSEQPSGQPSLQPSSQPSIPPSSHPSTQPSGEPTSQPSDRPSMQPSTQPTEKPSSQPVTSPSCQPSTQPSNEPSYQPIAEPSGKPSLQPTMQPINKPTHQPSMQPSTQPSRQPSNQPSNQPSLQPRAVPTGQPTGSPSERPTSEWTITLPKTYPFTTLTVHEEAIMACGEKGHCVLVESVNGELWSEFSLHESLFSVLSLVTTDKVVVSSTTDSSSEVKHCSVTVAHLTCDATLFTDALFVGTTSVSLSNKIVLLGQYEERLLAATMTLPDLRTQSYFYSISNTKSVVLSQTLSPPNFVASFIACTAVRSVGLPVNYVIFSKLRSDYGALTAMSLAPARGNIMNSAQLVNAMALEYIYLDAFIAGGLLLNDGNGIHAYLMRVNGLFGNILYCVRYHINAGGTIALTDTSDFPTSVTRGISLVGDTLIALVEVTSVGASATTTTHIAVLQINTDTGAIVKQVNIAAPNGSFTCSSIILAGSYLMMSCALNHSAPEKRESVLISTSLELAFTKLPAELVLLEDGVIFAEFIPFVQRALVVTTHMVAITTAQYAYTSANEAPSRMPSVAPTLNPSQRPSIPPSKQPSSSPSISPQPTSQPSSSGPTNTYKPTVQPSPPRSTAPSIEPTIIHSVPPTIIPTAPPTASPSQRPRASSTVAPTAAPTRTPSAKPTRAPTTRPTIMPTRVPSVTSTKTPTAISTETVGGTVQSGIKMSKVITIIVACVGGVCALIWIIYYGQLLLRYCIQVVEKDKRRVMFVKESGEVVNLQYPILHAILRCFLKAEPSPIVADKGKHNNNVNGEGEDSGTSYGRGANMDSFVDLEANIPDAKIPQVLTTHSSANTNDERRAGLLANRRTDAEFGESDDNECEESDSDMVLSEESSQDSEYASSVCSESSNRDVASDTSYNGINSSSSNAQSQSSGDSAEYAGSVSGSKYSEVVESDAELSTASRSSDASVYDDSYHSLGPNPFRSDAYEECSDDTNSNSQNSVNEDNNSLSEGNTEETDPNDIDGYDDIGTRDCNESGYFESDSGSSEHFVYNDDSVHEHDANDLSGGSSIDNSGSVASGISTVDNDLYYLW